jgi:predicted nuclease of predicted toxin-antitoxin system
LKGFLFDENLPRCLTVIPSLPIVHSTSFGKSLSDTTIWNYGQQNLLAIVTKDTDFSDRIMLSSPPPWIIHVRFGNLRRKEFHSLLAKMWPRIEALLPVHKLICVYVDRIESFRD